MARCFIPKNCVQAKELVLRRVEADLDRDQRHLLRLAETGELSQMGARGAGWIRVLVEGTALRDQPSCAGGGRRFRQSASTIPARWNSATGSGPCCGNSHRPKFDEADFGRFLELLPRKLEGRALRHVVEVRHDGFCVPVFIALLRKFERLSCSPSTANTRRSPTSSATS